MIIIAPMAGVTDLPFRRLAYSFGAPATVTEMVACQELVSGKGLANARATVEHGIGPVIVQLAGRDAHWFAEGARVAADLGAEVIDLNFGCPAKKVTGGAAGAALMRNVALAQSCVEAVAMAVPQIPVTVKMRLGWDKATRNAVDVAKAASNAGAARIVVHGRTRCEFYTGKADWKAIAPVKASVSVPVLANGDICSPQDAVAAREQSGADGVMVGRGSLGRPWLAAQIADSLSGKAPRPAPDSETVLDGIRRFYEDSLGFYGIGLGVRMARKHLAAFIDHHEELGDVPTRKVLRGRICSEDNPSNVQRLLADAFHPLTRAAS